MHVFCSQVQVQNREKVYARIYHVIKFEVEHLHILFLPKFYLGVRSKKMHKPNFYHGCVVHPMHVSPTLVFVPIFYFKCCTRTKTSGDKYPNNIY